MISRRTFAAIGAAMPFIGKSIAQDAAQVGKFSEQLRPDLSGGGGETFNDTPNKIQEPFMSHNDAISKLLSNKEDYDRIVSILYTANQQVSHIEPDIDVHKSFSLAAKITYQRDRLVTRALHEHEHGGYHNKLQAFLSDKVRELMWSKVAKRKHP